MSETHELLDRLSVTRRQKRREHRSIRNANAERQLAHARLAYREAVPPVGGDAILPERGAGKSHARRVNA